ncbi:uncharacterized protein TERG_08234 [Trichophyton rubrum CBS 118892]|uniref:Translationally-controlled tumor protein homolog n=1 Tax=Trichophyton rubrum (strain ATCC MYA-4607 / CBS 118892) TaxID=559305 RepID=F2T095_TRIRC|nr:uncharacterized protein TERG_08234 [Trichophyton rubrum CBS 118892]EGD92017.2 hypothetical protein TERG_08234 [Trichophyton rubrum CBS 118892]
MIIFKDIITDDELISDAYKMQDKGVIYEVDAKRVTKGADNIRTAPLFTSFALCLGVVANRGVTLVHRARGSQPFRRRGRRRHGGY